jgi:hypothetical protein
MFIKFVLSIKAITIEILERCAISIFKEYQKNDSLFSFDTFVMEKGE